MRWRLWRRWGLLAQRRRVVQVIPATHVGKEGATTEETKLGDDVVAAEHPTGEENVIGLMIPGVVREIPLREEPHVAPAFGLEAVGICGASCVGEDVSHMFSHVQEVVGVDVVEEMRADNLRDGEAEDEYGVTVDVDDVSVLAHTQIETKVDIVDTEREIEESEVSGKFSE